MGEEIPTIDIDEVLWNSIKQAAEKSKWMPKDYMMNDWVADVCDFLVEGVRVREIAETKVDPLIRAFWRRVEAYKNMYEKELPEDMPVAFKASMLTALMVLD